MAARKKSEEPSINIDEVLTDEELKAVANESEPAERKAKPEDGPRTVVVAEDEAVNRMDLVAMLEDNGYEVVGQAANGEEAVELTRKYRPDVVCMDVKMPRMDGITAAGIICDENIAPVMLTAFSQTDLVKKATGAGAMAYVTKPYEESKLLPTLEVAMGRFAEINDLLDSVERSERKLKETTDQLKETEEKLKKAEDTLEERKLVDRAKGLTRRTSPSRVPSVGFRRPPWTSASPRSAWLRPSSPSTAIRSLLIRANADYRRRRTES